ncbi:chemotaxis protein CheW [Desulfocicer niacini]
MRSSQEHRESRAKEKIEKILGKAEGSTPCRLPASANFYEDESEQDIAHFLAFQVAHQQFALPLKQVARVLRMVALIPVPEAPDVIAGLMNIHGKVMPVISLRARLGLESSCPDVNDRIVLIKTGDRTLGLIVENVEAVLTVTADQIEPPRGSLLKSHLLHALIRKADDIYLVLSADALDPERSNSHSQRPHGDSAKK